MTNDPNMAWDGTRWLRWDGSQWLDASTAVAPGQRPAVIAAGPVGPTHPMSPVGVPPTKSNTPLILAISLGGFALLIIFVVIIVALVSSGNGETAAPTPKPSITLPTPTPTPTTRAPTPTPPVVVDHSQVLKQYFDAFGTDSAVAMQPTLTLVAPNSPAYLYTQYQISTNLADTVAKVPPRIWTATVTGDMVSMVQNFTRTPTKKERAQGIAIYKDFQFSPEGLIQTWTSDPGGPLAPRIAAQTATATKDNVTISLKIAYSTNLGDLYVTYEAANRSGNKATVYVRRYINPNGRPGKGWNMPFKQLHPAAGGSATGYSGSTNGQRGGYLLVEFNGKKEARLPVL